MSFVKTFVKRYRKAYTECGKDLARRLPLTNKVLRISSSVDPQARGNITCQLFKETVTCTLLEFNIEQVDAVVILYSWPCIFYGLVIFYIDVHMVPF